MGKFVEKDGNVYEKGINNEKLKGTLPPTDVKAIRKQQAKQKMKKEKEKKAKIKKEELEILKRNKDLTESGYAKKKRTK